MIFQAFSLLLVLSWSFLLRLAVFVLQNEAHGHVDVVNEEQHRLGREITRRFWLEYVGAAAEMTVLPFSTSNLGKIAYGI